MNVTQKHSAASPKPYPLSLMPYALNLKPSAFSLLHLALSIKPYAFSLRHLAFSLMLLLLSSTAFATGNDPEYRNTLFGRNSEIAINAELYTYDVNYDSYKATAGAIEKTYYVKNAVRLMIDEETINYATSDFTVNMKLFITKENAAGTIDTITKILTLNYKKGQGQVSDAIATYAFRDAIKVNVKIMDISATVAWDVRKNLKLVNEIISLRDWGFNCSTAISAVTTDSLFQDEWKVQWDPTFNFQTEYDLEWAWVDESAIAGYTVSGSVDLNLVFDNNSTRITTSDNYYRIPLLYESEGRIYARVRMAQVKVTGQRVEGNWYYLSDAGVAYLPRTEHQGHEDSLNWQATTTFAEEGKRKTVIQYFDGTLRGRQTVTKDNVNRTTVVAESFYDYQGRPVIQVLPSPTLSTIIQFTKNFNQFDDARNAKTVYDKLDGTESACSKLTAKMLNTATGSAAQYYSDQNPLKDIGYNKFIPDAQGYPYTETRYTNDGTGRVDAQGGVGPVFQVNSGREAKYYYESVDQDDLDALFGTDAGYASHYSKNWVRDANGQYSVSYVDMKGKTVATALAGSSPENLQALPSYSTALKTITRQLIDNETNNVNGNSIVSSKSLMVAKPGNFNFDYTLSPEKLKMMLCTGTQFCFDCLYELNISIIPDCADKTIAGLTNPVVKKNFNLGEYLTSCTGNNSPLLDTSFTIWLDEGAYTVVKELKLSTAARDWYREEVYIPNDTCKTKADFIAEQYALALSQQHCYTTCTQCNSILGTLAQFTTRVKTEGGFTDDEITSMTAQITAAYNEARANCNKICDNETGETTDELNDIRDIMLMDMTPPMGQYARLNDDDHPGYQALPYNIFNPTHYSFRQPYNYNAGTGATTPAAGYVDQYGHINLTIAQLTNMAPSTFTDNFEEGYAEDLLYYHPEFCKLKFAEANLKGTYRFGDRLQNTETWAQALSRGFINTSTTNTTTAANYLMQKDSFFIKAGMSSKYADSMRSAIISHFVAGNPACTGSADMGMWKLAKLSVFCHKEMKDNAGQTPDVNGCFTPSPEYWACFLTINDLPPSSLGHCDADMNMVWRNFRTFYTSYRNTLISRYLTDNCNSIDYNIFNTSTGFNYQERFIRLHNEPPYSIEGNDLNGLLNSNDPADYTAVMGNEADSICRANSGNWMYRLRRCTAIETLATDHPEQWTSDSTWLSNNLVKICSQGVDYMGHPFGAASLPDHTPPVMLHTNPDAVLTDTTVHSFPELIRYYLNFRGISIDAYCYPELVDFPKAYNVAPPTVLSPIITIPEPCACERITYFKTLWENAGSPGTFSDYLLNTHGTAISQDTLNMLVQMCTSGYTSTDPNCNFLTAPIKLPAIFQCRGTATLDSSKTCITCADYAAIKQQFYDERGVAAPIVDPQTDADLALNHAFQDFANYKTGFSKLWTEYVQFGLLCANDSSYNCDYLDQLLTAYNATDHPVSGDSCRNAFVLFMNNATGSSYTYNQWVQIFIKACGRKPPICVPVFTCANLTQVIYDYYEEYGMQIWKNSNCQLLFAAFFNTEFSSGYTYTEIMAFYATACSYSCQSEVCNFPNAHLLTYLYNKYKSTVYDPAWTMTECHENFANYYNTQFGLTEDPQDWDDIVKVYEAQTCVPDITQLCTPPYSCTQLSNILALFYAAHPGADSTANCRDSLRIFFNEQMNTSYTFTEIAYLVASICGISVEQPCQGGVVWDCKEMILLTQDFPCADSISTDRCECFRIYFNTHYDTTFTYEQIRELYFDHCGFALNLCPVETPVFNCDMLQYTLKNFYAAYPGGGVTLGLDCHQFFAAYFNNYYSTDLGYSDINDLYQVQCGDSLHICESQCTEYIAFVNNYISHYGDIKIPLAARQQLFAFLFNTAFGYGTPGSTTDPLLYSEIKGLMNGCLTMPSGLETENLYLTLNDADVLHDLKIAYYLMHPSGMPGDCTDDFASWVNWLFGTEKTYGELKALYNSILGAGAGNICGDDDEGGGGVGLPGHGEGGGEDVIIQPMLCGLNVEIFTPSPVDTSNCHDPLLLAISEGTVKYQLYLDSLRRNFDVAWHNKCVSAKALESFTVTYEKAEHHYTLYYYDQAGQLVRTVPPEGVDENRNSTYLTNVKTARNTNSGTVVKPSHTLTTEYRYNTLGQVVQQKSPDGGLSKFWYDVLGRLVVSQNAQQYIDEKYSYTIYDELGRIQEVGQKPQSTTMTQAKSRNPGDLNTWLTATTNREQITRTVYDVTYFNGDDVLTGLVLTQRNLRNRVSYTQVFDEQPLSPSGGGSGEVWAGTHRAATFYTYDIHGNVDTLLQDYGSHSEHPNAMNGGNSQYKRIAYNYDLISGKVNIVTYQPGYISPTSGDWISPPDQFYHRYAYDAENNLTDVYTSHDSLIWERDARYTYYRHGPLARAVYGQQQVQGMDYAYTLPGWQKGVNSTAISAAPTEICAEGTAVDTLNVSNREQYGHPANYVARREINFIPTFTSYDPDLFTAETNPALGPCNPQVMAATYVVGDMGEDGKPGSDNQWVARDAYGYSLNYFTTAISSVTVNDYQSINTSVQPFATGLFSLTNINHNTIAKPLFNGNIASMLVNLPIFSPSATMGAGSSPSGAGGAVQLYGYSYDQLNRIKSMDAFTGFDDTTNSFTGGTPTASANYRERISYDANGNIKTYVRNGYSSPSGAGGAMDSLTYGYNTTSGKLINNRLRHVKDAIGDANYTEDIDNQADDNYGYDAIGNLTSDVKEGISNITWSVYGKILSITKGTDTIKYTYDADGNRISKRIIHESGAEAATWYVRDASGNVMGVYEKRSDLNDGDLTQSEVHLYGSSRIGVWNINRNVEHPPLNTTGIYTFIRGYKFFELVNHLGNVLATLSDRKLAVDLDNDGVIDYYVADVITAADYYPFGMDMPGRTFGQADRYGFNGKERDKDMNSLTAYDYGFRIYNPPIGRFLSVDPITKTYPELTPYQFASNTPIQAIDLDGLERVDMRVNGITYSVFGPVTNKEAARLLKSMIPQSEKDKYARSIRQQYINRPTNAEKDFVEAANAMGRISNTAFDVGEAYLRVLSLGASKYAAEPLINKGRQSANELQNMSARSTQEPAARPGTTTLRGTDADNIRIPTTTGSNTVSNSNNQTGKIYEVPGEDTKSGDPYVGRTKQSLAQRGSSDGRNRSNAKIIGTYDPTKPGQGAYMEQLEIQRRGLDNLDNKRNEVNPNRMRELEKKYKDGNTCFKTGFF